MLHYSARPGGSSPEAVKYCSFNYTSDCIKDNCVFGAIVNYTRKLSTEPQNSEYFKFLIHFVADSHQPLHVGFTADRGGNEINVKTQINENDSRHHRNLHEVWDSTILSEILHSQYGGSKSGLISDLLNRIKTDPIWSEWSSQSYDRCMSIGDIFKCVNYIAIESAIFSCGYAYVNTGEVWIPWVEGETTVLDKTYFDSRSEVVLKRLAVAGVRLTAILNSLYSDQRRSGEDVIRT